MALFRKYREGKEYIGGIDFQDSRGSISFLLNKIFSIFTKIKNSLCDVHERDLLVLNSNTFSGNLDKVSPTVQVIEFDKFFVLDSSCFSVDSTTAAKEITVKKNGVYLLNFYCSIETTYDGEYIFAAISPKNKSPYGFTGVGAYSGTGTNTLGELHLHGIATLHKGDILRVITGSITGSENGVKKQSGTGSLSILRIKPYTVK